MSAVLEQEQNKVNGVGQQVQLEVGMHFTHVAPQGCSVLQFKRLGSRKASPDGG
jgi:hypothetical protein